ncbi:methyltransferase [Streptomyces sp. PTM05]|uniref:Ribosomal RNA large subunit methyltransferase G n=1 Tax=Streptantibioticus parmotrematis TaxID=2873249 RepID=A0ABS7QPC9_9ACTN|nr:methyltransferase [Streptantibioticus parmotrematis]MBY8885036.1 methyltransferase [Streptantibioticus parmotrematis]
MNRFTTGWGAYDLTRFPEDPRDTLRAWDAADEYLLRHLRDEGVRLDGPDCPGRPDGAVVALGDRWGALVTALAAARPVQITDSYLTQCATRANLRRAGVPDDAVTLRSTLDEPPARVGVLLVRVPKSLALLEDQLIRLAPSVHEGTVIVGAGMVSEIHTSTLKLFDRVLGPTRTSLAVKKARLIFCAPRPAARAGGAAGPAPGAAESASSAAGPASGAAAPADPWPRSYVLPSDAGAASGLTVVNHAGIFCADRLDIGTRFFLNHLPERSGADRIVDLGCGNGVVGTAAALANPGATVTFTDESYQAVASARATFTANAGEEAAGERARFLVADSLAGLEPDSVDLVLNNPPFHSHRATTDTTARRMFADARRALRPGGELWVVGNRHLGYHIRLRRLFGDCELVVGDPKFVILRAVKR